MHCKRGQPAGATPFRVGYSAGPVGRARVNGASLLVVQGLETGTRFELRETPVHLGRGAQNEFRILDTEVSRNHAEIVKTPEGFVITDRNSSNGTFVNGQQIRSKTLVNGDQI